MFRTFYKQMQFFEEVRFFVVFHVTKLEPDHISFNSELLIIFFWYATGIAGKNFALMLLF